MEFNDPDEEGEELGLPVLSIHDTRMSNSGGGAMVSEAGELAKATSLVEVGGPDHWKSYEGCRGGGGSGVKYRECLKNHAVGIGGSAVDGCGEFMAAGEEGTIDALQCAACGCHRNFHRKEQEEGGGGEGATRRGAVWAVAGYYPHLLPNFKTPVGYLHHHYAASALAQHPRPAPLALPSTSQEDASQPLVTAGDAAGSGSRKRFRSKFTQEQKERMLAFAEQLGWRIQKHDEAAVQQFCRDACIKRHVFKVWMHNNKHTLVMRRFGREEMALNALV